MDSVVGMRVFARVVETGNFSAAARQLGVAPSSISRQIGDLEDELGARLFQRTTRKLSLTEAGQLYYGRARQILVDVDEANIAVSQISGAPSGILRLTATAGIGRMHIAPALLDFHEKFPAVKIGLSLSDRVVDLVEEGFDLAIRVGRQRDSSLVARKIKSSHRVVCASPEYLDKMGAPRTPADLEDHNCLTFRAQPGSNVWTFRGAQGKIEVQASGSLFADSADALPAAATAGLGVILAPSWLIECDLVEDRLKEILPDYQVMPDAMPIYAVYPQQRHLAPKVRAFIDFLVERFQETPPGDDD